MPPFLTAMNSKVMASVTVPTTDTSFFAVSIRRLPTRSVSGPRRSTAPGDFGTLCETAFCAAFRTGPNATMVDAKQTARTFEIVALDIICLGQEQSTGRARSATRKAHTSVALLIGVTSSGDKSRQNMGLIEAQVLVIEAIAG